MTSGAWIVSAAVVGLASSAVFSSLLRLERAPFVLAHALAVCAFVGIHWRLTGIELLSASRYRARAGVLAGLVLGLVLATGVARQPAAAVPQGLALVAALGWYGVVYGLADAMLLTVVPVFAVRAASADAGEMGGWDGARWTLASLAGSLVVTAFYHLGFDEFRGLALIQPVLGNAVVTAGYLMTRNPLTPILSHAIMHLAAVLHGMEATVQLPPHY